MEACKAPSKHVCFDLHGAVQASAVDYVGVAGAIKRVASRDCVNLIFLAHHLFHLEGPCQRDRPSHAIKARSPPLLSLHKWKSEPEVWLSCPCRVSLGIHLHYHRAVGETLGPKQKQWKKNEALIYVSFSSK